jgi:ABC-2 type transport system permease protein
VKKILLIGWKDVVLAFRDRTALVLMLAAPFVLTIGLGFVTGRLSGGGSSGLSDIPVAVVNQDQDQLGDALVAVLQSEELAALLAPEVLEDEAAARQRVDADQAAAAILIPAGFTRSVIPAAGQAPAGGAIPITLVVNPTRPTSAAVVQSIVDEFASRVEIGQVGSLVAVAQLIDHGLIAPADAERAGADIGRRAAAAPAGGAISLRDDGETGEAVQFDVLAYMAPGMALMFLMFTASNGGRTLLAERAQGTLPRLLVSPTTMAQALAGKTLGIYLTGAAQMLILILASTLLFGLQWGDPLGVLALILAAVAGAVGWGMLLAAVVRTPGQVASIGSALTLTFGILGGSFISLDNLPAWLRAASRITPNAWGLDGFLTLASGGRAADVAIPVLALLAMGGGLFAIAVAIMRRRGIAQP